MDTATLFKLHRLGLIKRLPGGKWRRRASTIPVPAAPLAVAPAPLPAPPAPPTGAMIAAPTVATAVATYLMRSSISTGAQSTGKTLHRYVTTRSFR